LNEAEEENPSRRTGRELYIAGEFHHELEMNTPVIQAHVKRGALVSYLHTICTE
jgi:hypothetical protein